MLEHGLRSSSCLDATLRTLHPSHLSSRLPRGQLCQLSALLRPTLSYQLAGKDLLTKMVCGYMTKSLVSMAPVSAQSLTDMWDCSQMDWQDGTFTSKGSAGAVSSLPQKLCSQGKKRLFTFRDAGDDQTHQATQQQGASLGFPPPKPLQQEDTTNTGWDFHCSKGKLCQVDVQTKISHVQTQTVVDDAVNEPENRAESQQSHLLAMRKYSSDLH